MPASSMITSVSGPIAAAQSGRSSWSMDQVSLARVSVRVPIWSRERGRGGRGRGQPDDLAAASVQAGRGRAWRWSCRRRPARSPAAPGHRTWPSPGPAPPGRRSGRCRWRPPPAAPLDGRGVDDGRRGGRRRRPAAARRRGSAARCTARRRRPCRRWSVRRAAARGFVDAVRTVRLRATDRCWRTSSTSGRPARRPGRPGSRRRGPGVALRRGRATSARSRGAPPSPPATRSAASSSHCGVDQRGAVSGRG